MARRFYAVQNGTDYACDYGSTVKRTAYQMARALHKQYPEDEIRIAICTTDDDYVEEEIILYKGYNIDEQTREYQKKTWGWK